MAQAITAVASRMKSKSVGIRVPLSHPLRHHAPPPPSALACTLFSRGHNRGLGLSEGRAPRRRQRSRRAGGRRWGAGRRRGCWARPGPPGPRARPRAGRRARDGRPRGCRAGGRRGGAGGAGPPRTAAMGGERLRSGGILRRPGSGKRMRRNFPEREEATMARQKRRERESAKERRWRKWARGGRSWADEHEGLGRSSGGGARAGGAAAWARSRGSCMRWTRGTRAKRERFTATATPPRMLSGSIPSTSCSCAGRQRHAARARGGGGVIRLDPRGRV